MAEHNSMIEQLRDAAARVSEIEKQLNDPLNNTSYASLLREYHRLVPLSEHYHTVCALYDRKRQAEELAASEENSEYKRMAAEELDEVNHLLQEQLNQVQQLLLVTDEDDERDVIVEIRSGAGGEEAALFAAVLYRMYHMYADKKGWRVELLDTNETELGGFRYISFSLSGQHVISYMKYESGVHRIQRVPQTESQGRIQTSTATVAVLPEVQEVEIHIDPADIKMETYRSSGAGGQHINKTDSAVRLIHLPTGMVAECQEERSQFKNRDKAMKLLRARLYDRKKKEQEQQIRDTRKTQVGTADRSERIRTYNYPQGRITDHRIGLTLYSLDRFINGDMDEMMQALRTNEAQQRLKQAQETEE